MSPRAVVISALAVVTCLLVGAVMLAMLTAEPDQVTIQEPRETYAWEVSAPPSGEACRDAAAARRVALPPSGTARVFKC